MPEASLHIEKEALKFSAAHFTIFSATEAERLHGHNYHVSLDVWGDLGGEGLIIDVSELKRVIKTICDGYDERTLIPTSSSHLRITELPNQHVEIIYSDRRYIFPRADCQFLPVPNITIEALAQLIGEQLRAALATLPNAHTIRRLRVGVEESRGQMGFCELTL